MNETNIAFKGALMEEEDWEDLVFKFERRVLPKSRWTHAAHLVVGAWYCSSLDLDSAIEKLRVNISAHNESVGTVNSDTSGYHETITVFWAHVIRAFIKSRPNCASFVELANTVVDAFGNKSGLFREYYSFDILHSTDARKNWITPDLKAFDEVTC